MAKLTNVEFDVAYDVPSDTAYSKEQRAWIAGSQRFSDETGDEYAFEPDAPVVEPPKVSPVEFKLLFTAGERVAIKAARASDPVIDDFFSIIEDPRLTHVNLGLQSTQDALGYLETKGLITDARRVQILAGQVQ